MEELYVFAIAWFIGGFMAGITGLGGAMVALPITISYLPPTSIVPITVVAVTCLSLAMYLLYKAHVNVKAVISLTISSVPGSVLGAYILLFISMQKIQIFAGLVMLFFIIWQLMPKGEKTYPDSITKSIATGFASGFLNTSVAFSGPPIGIYAILVGWSKETFFSTISLSTFFICIVTMGIYAFSGLYTLDMLPYIYTIIPSVLFGILLAYPVSKRVNKMLFRKLVLIVIFVAGAICLYRGFGFTFLS